MCVIEYTTLILALVNGYETRVCGTYCIVIVLHGRGIIVMERSGSMTSDNHAVGVERSMMARRRQILLQHGEFQHLCVSA